MTPPKHHLSRACAQLPALPLCRGEGPLFCAAARKGPGGQWLRRPAARRIPAVAAMAGQSGDIAQELLNLARETGRRYGMWRAGDRVLVAVSGGPDSAALLDVMARLRAEEGLELAVAHFNHGLRPEADAEEEHVRKLAERYGLEFYAGRGDVRAEAESMGRGIEAAARKLRYQFLEETARRVGCRRIALGHTASDRVETVLINLLRGAGLWGLRGMPAVRGRIVRPLIRAWRWQTEQYCRARGIEYVVDRSNLEAGQFLRNKVRLELLPYLEREYWPGVQEAILRAAEAVEMELEWTQPLVREALERADFSVEGQVAKLRAGAIAEMPQGLAIRAVREAAERVLGPLWDWQWKHFEAILQIASEGRTGAAVSLPGGASTRVRYGFLEIGRLPEPAEPLAERPLPVPGVVELPEAGLVLEARLVPAEEAPPPGKMTAILRPELADGLSVRGWRPGDRFRPMGMRGTKKLQDLFVDEKVPRERRGLVPIVVHKDRGIIWVVGLRLAEGVAAPPGVERVLVIRAAATPDECEE